ncbi:MAG TPA: hypothetical protein DCY17_07165, partial [Clostridiales bacterium]|nr:hypothetical protein [Clostridiales bacterium]
MGCIHRRIIAAAVPNAAASLWTIPKIDCIITTLINDVCGIARPAAVGMRFAPRFAKHGSKNGKQEEKKMTIQYEDNILPDLKPFLDENLRLAAIPAKN